MYLFVIDGVMIVNDFSKLKSFKLARNYKTRATTKEA